MVDVSMAIKLIKLALDYIQGEIDTYEGLIDGNNSRFKDEVLENLKNAKSQLEAIQNNSKSE